MKTWVLFGGHVLIFFAIIGGAGITASALWLII
jgi:hypothetical protein